MSLICETLDRMGLPERVAPSRVHDPVDGSNGALFAIVSRDGVGSYDAGVVKQGRVYLTLTGYRTFLLPSAVPAEERQPPRATDS